MCHKRKTVRISRQMSAEGDFASPSWGYVDCTTFPAERMTKHTMSKQNMENKMGHLFFASTAKYCFSRPAQRVTAITQAEKLANH
jgi:hypothetical protein